MRNSSVSLIIQVALLVPHLRPVIQMCLDVSGDKNLGETVRVKAITFLGYITRLKKKVRKKVDNLELVSYTDQDEAHCFLYYQGFLPLIILVSDPMTYLQRIMRGEHA